MHRVATAHSVLFCTLGHQLCFGLPLPLSEDRPKKLGPAGVPFYRFFFGGGFEMDYRQKLGCCWETFYMFAYCGFSGKVPTWLLFCLTFFAPQTQRQTHESW